MIFTANRQKLKTAVTNCKKALSKVTIQEERSHLLFSMSDKTLYIQGTNNDMKARFIMTIEREDGSDFAFTADPKMLDKVLAKTEKEEVSIEVNPEDWSVKVYTGKTKKSFVALQSFPPDTMLTMEDAVKREREESVVNREVLIFTLKYAQSYLAPPKEDQKQFDFVVIDKGIAFSANGSNKMGFIAFKTLKDIEACRIRKNMLPVYRAFLGSIKDREVKFFQTEKDVGVESADGSIFFAALKSNLQAHPIPKEHIKSQEPYTIIDKDLMLKTIERLTAGVSTALPTGIELKLTGNGETSIDLKLLAKLESHDTLPCRRVDDSDEEISHIVDFQLLKTILKSFDTDKEVRLHINENNTFFKIYNSGEVDEEKYILAGIGTYARVVS